MIRLQTYAAFSLLATASAVYYAFSSREQFYPAMVYLSTSKICFVLLLNTGLVAMCVAWQLVKRLFLGSLREAEVERLNEQAWREVVEILFAVTIFRQEFSVSFLAMVAALLLIKALHWLAQKRVEYIETTPSVPLLSHIRIVSFMVFLLIVDCLFLSNSLRPLIQKWEASVAIFFSFEYMILATSTVSTFVKYVFYVSDMLMEGQWERKAVYTFYLELISDLVHLSLYMLFFIAIFLNYGVPLHLIRELYETFRNFRIRIADYVRYRKIASNMNERFPDATAEELNAAPIIPPDNGRSTSARQYGGQPGVQPAAGTDTPASEGAPGDNMSRRQAKLEAAVAAASLYGRSFVYPPANTLNRSGPQSTSSTPQSEASNPNQSQKDQELQIQNSSDGLAPLPFSAHGATGSGPSTSNLENSLQKAQENFIKSQIEMLQIQLQMIRHGAAVSVTNNENDEHKRND
ncbi:ERAD-associated E3 ubiquitin-protein ligase HRD1-like isoform X5 [Miscanthus floridulus]|uniref:ERAD-associated E3 ubiquitin-protein ligase HRD1-like isoform X5 n=1 Tax=Miscanthus floridulus TaxID=154761 RepID=UPI0034579514